MRVLPEAGMREDHHRTAAGFMATLTVSLNCIVGVASPRGFAIDYQPAFDGIWSSERAAWITT
jgi:hypothetical protein